MALSVEMVQSMLDALESKISVRINSFVMGEGQPIKDAIDTHRAAILKQEDKFTDHEQRMNELVTQFNLKTSQTVEELTRQNVQSLQIVEEVKRQQEVVAQQQTQADKALNETKGLDARLQVLTSGLDDYKAERDSLLGQMHADNS